jgi:hypothetical protein
MKLELSRITNRMAAIVRSLAVHADSALNEYFGKGVPPQMPA